MPKDEHESQEQAQEQPQHSHDIINEDSFAELASLMADEEEGFDLGELKRSMTPSPTRTSPRSRRSRPSSTSAGPRSRSTPP